MMEKTNSNPSKKFSITFNVPLFVAALMLVLQLVTACNYGIFGDELYFIACSEHLDFGYVDHPPLAALLTLLSRIFFGSSLLALKISPALAGAAVVLLAAAIARNLGGSQFAQGLAALTVLVS
ncbi:MAG: glycosyltransferase, partial [Candidatus Bathyarchaeia archaeon]